jgi:replicative DNA helicase
VVDLIQEKDFYRPDHRLIFRVLAEMARRNSPFDVLTVAEALSGTLDHDVLFQK